MKLKIQVAIAAVLFAAKSEAQTSPRLHVNPRWHECSFQIDGALTQSAWHQFTEEAGLVTYFRSLSDARPMGRGNFEVSLLQWQTGIDDKDAAWNDTFVHPDSSHWLFEGNGLKFPGLMIRSGITSRTDLAAYITKSPGANYGFYGAQLQRALVGNVSSKWAVSARASYVSIYGPEDLDFAVLGADLLASRTIRLNGWATVSPYASVSNYLAASHEKTTAVTLHDEVVPGSQASVGAALNLAAMRFGIEYNTATVKSFSLKMGVGF